MKKQVTLKDLNRIIIDIEERPKHLDISFMFKDSGELFSSSEFKGKTQKILSKIQKALVMLLVEFEKEIWEEKE